MAYIFEILADHLDPRFPSFSLLGSNRSWHPNSLWQLWTQHFFCHLCDIFPMSAWFCKILTSFECAFYLQIFAQERMANLTSMDVVSVDDDGKVVPSDAETVATTFPETDGSSDEDDGTLAIHCIIFFAFITVCALNFEGLLLQSSAHSILNFLRRCCLEGQLRL